MRSAASDTASETNSVALFSRRPWRCGVASALSSSDARLDVVHQLADFALDIGDVFGDGVTVAVGVTGTILPSHDVPLLPAALRFREFAPNA